MEYLSIISIVILFLTLLTILLYTIETYKLRKINRDILEIEREKLKPNVRAYLDYMDENHIIKIIIENIGGGIAKDVVLILNPELKTDSVDLINIFYENPLLNEGVSILLPNQKYSTVVGSTVGTYDLYNSNKISVKYQASLIFMDSKGDKYKNDDILNVTLLFKRSYLKTEYIKIMDEINETLKKIETKMK